MKLPSWDYDSSVSKFLIVQKLRDNPVDLRSNYCYILTILTTGFHTGEMIYTDIAHSAETIDFKVIEGKWVRPDGGYVIHVRNIGPDGTVDAGYFNPGKINVSEANVSEFKGLVKLFIKLQDKGYPGSTYALYYYAEKDALAGFYYQATVKKHLKWSLSERPGNKILI